MIVTKEQKKKLKKKKAGEIIKQMPYSVVCACAAKLYRCNQEHNFHVTLKDIKYY